MKKQKEAPDNRLHVKCKRCERKVYIDDKDLDKLMIACPYCKTMMFTPKGKAHDEEVKARALERYRLLHAEG